MALCNSHWFGSSKVVHNGACFVCEKKLDNSKFSWKHMINKSYTCINYMQYVCLSISLYLLLHLACLLCQICGRNVIWCRWNFHGLFIIHTIPIIGYGLKGFEFLFLVCLFTIVYQYPPLCLHIVPLVFDGKAAGFARSVPRKRGQKKSLSHSEPLCPPKAQLLSSTRRSAKRTRNQSACWGTISSWGTSVPSPKLKHLKPP